MINNFLVNNASFNLMNGRLGYTDKQDPLSKQYIPEEILEDSNDECTDKLGKNIKLSMRQRLMQHGGLAQQERMIKDKRRALDNALLYSYQSANVKKLGADESSVRALINPNKTKMNYDDKILSVGFEYGFAPGDVFEWLGTNTYWLIYLQDLTELAYFRGDIRKCSYQINWINEDGEEMSTWAAVRGPVETKIDYIQKHQISVDNPNYSLYVLMPRNEQTVKYFKRYSKFYIQDSDVCWRVEASDDMSTPGILEFTAVEYYANESEDDIEKGLVGSLKIKQESPNTKEEEYKILGDTFIKPKVVYTYKYNGLDTGSWRVNKKYPVRLEPNPADSREVHLIWDKPQSGQFEIQYGNVSKIIVVESLF